MKKRILKLFKQHGIESVNIEYYRPQLDYCCYRIDFRLDGVSHCIDGEYDVCDKEEGKSGMLRRVEAQLINYIKGY